MNKLEKIILDNLDSIEFIVGAIVALGASYLIAYCWTCDRNEKKNKEKYGK